jgi:hypothetical protein
VCSGSSTSIVNLHRLSMGRAALVVRAARRRRKFVCYMWEGYRRHTGPVYQFTSLLDFTACGTYLLQDRHTIFFH